MVQAVHENHRIDAVVVHRQVLTHALQVAFVAGRLRGAGTIQGFVQDFHARDMGAPFGEGTDQRAVAAADIDDVGAFKGNRLAITSIALRRSGAGREGWSGMAMVSPVRRAF